MALTEIPSELSSTPSIVDGGNATAITLNADESVTFAGGVNVSGTATMGGLTVDGNARIEEIGAIAKLTLERGGTANSADSAAVDMLETNSGTEGANFGDLGTNGFRLKLDGSANDFLIQSGAANVINTRFGIDRDTGDISFYNSSGTSQSLFWDSSAESLGIGTSLPSTNIHIKTSTAGSITSGADRQGSVIRLEHDANYEAGYSGGDFLGGLEFYSGDSSGGQGVRTAIKTTIDNPYNTHSLSFYTAPSNSLPIVERMRIDSSGNVGINTSLPTHLLQISGGASDGRMSFTNNARGNAQSDGMWVGVDNTQSYLLSRGAYPLNFYTNATERMRIDASGTTGFFGAAANTRGDITLTTGTSDSTKRWGFGGGATGNNAVFYVINESNVGVYLGHGAQGWTAHSDERIKENITSVGTVLPSLMNMRCVKFNLISNPAVTKIGFIAQDWESAFPEVVDENEHLVLEADGTIGTEDDSDSTTPVKAMAYTETIPLLLKAIQEQQATIEALTQRIQTLENN